MHRALADARATVHVLHALLERLGSRGVLTLGDLRIHSGRETSAQLARRHLAWDLPRCPGVFTFRDDVGQALLTGADEDLRTGVRRFLTGDERRVRVLEAVAVTAQVDTVRCRTALEAELVLANRLAAERPRIPGPPPTGRWWDDERLAGVRAARTLVLATPTAAGGWDVDGLAGGVLVAAERVDAGSPPGPAAARVRDATAAAAGEPAAADPAAGQPGAGEPGVAAALLRGLERPGVRLVALDGLLSCAVDLRRRRTGCG